jgi:NDP-sugar pyrophosphorylase family protein
MTRLLVVPAAGLGSRLNAGVPKALVPVAGRPMIDHLIDRCLPHVSAVVVVCHPSFAGAMRERLESAWRHRVHSEVVEQPAPTGMLDALLLAVPAAARFHTDRIWTVWCDQVGLLPATLSRLAEAERAVPPPALVFPTVRQSPPYIHFDRDTTGRIVRVLQRREQDAMPDQGESDMGLFAFSRNTFSELLVEFARDAATGRGTGERNFLPFIPWLAGRAGVVTIPSTDPREAVGVNTPEDLQLVEAWLEQRAAGTA